MSTLNLTINTDKLKQNFYKGNDPSEVTFEYLVQLWNVIRTTSKPLTAIQYRCEESSDQYSALQGITPEAAKIKFSVAVKKYNANNPDRDIVEATRRQGPIIVTNNSIQLAQSVHVVKEGYIEDYTAIQASIRQVADIIAMYTTYNHKAKTITTVFTPEACKQVRIPYLDLVAIRQSLEVDDLDANEARAKIMFKLQYNKTHPYYWFYCLQVILHHDSMEKYRIPSQDAVAKWYEKQTKLEPKLRYKQYFQFHASRLELYEMTLEDSWKYALRSDALRGISKKRGLFTAGYYSFPISPHYIKWIAEARDILTVAARRNIKAIEMLDTNRMLIEILVTNGMVVVCRALSTVVGQYTGKGEAKRVLPGVYSQLPYAANLYRSLPVKPVLDNKTVKFDKVAPMCDGEIRSMYLMSVLPMCAIYPSTRVADGVVMTYYSSVEHAVAKPQVLVDMNNNIKELGTRFCRSVTWRNAFVFTRVPYYLRDPYCNFFEPNVTFPRLKDEEATAMFDTVETEDIELQVREITDDELGAVVRLRVPTKAFVELDIDIDDELIEVIAQRAEVYANDIEELHHRIYQALSKSDHALEALKMQAVNNRRLLWRVLKYLEQQMYSDRPDDLVPTLEVVQFNYKLYRDTQYGFSALHCDYQSYEEESEEEESQDKDDEEDEKDEDVKEDEVETSDNELDDDLFTNVITVDKEKKDAEEDAG